LKKPVPIERLLVWAYRDELPKAQGTGQRFLRPDTWSQPWGAVTKTGVLGLPVQEQDIRNRYGVEVDLMAQTEPHPDAIRVWTVVQDLAGWSLQVPEDWNPIEGLGIDEVEQEKAIGAAIDRLCYSAEGPPEAEYVASPEGRPLWAHWRIKQAGPDSLRLRKPVSALVEHYAKMGWTPEWEFQKPERKAVQENGKDKWYVRETIITESGSTEVELDGFDKKARIPKPGAYRKLFWDPNPVDAVLMRFEYELWHGAIEMLAIDLVNQLDEHLVLPCELPARPWEARTRSAPKLLVDLRQKQPSVHSEPRPVAGPPPKRGEHGEVRIVDAAEYQRKAG
jgi:hypothetical protein